MVDVPANNTTTAVLETALSGLGDLFGTYSGRFETPGDHDWIRVSLTAGQGYAFYLSAEETGALLGDDSFLTLRNAAGEVVATADNGGVFLNSYLAFGPGATGTYYIDVSLAASNLRGTYSVLMTNSTTGANAFQTTGDDDTTANALNQWLIGGQGDDLLGLGTEGYAALGEQGDDRLFGTSIYNALSGGLGNDQVVGNSGDDLIFGDAGDDLLFGDFGSDQIFGGDGFDDLFGDAGFDRLFGGADGDFLFGGTENDLLNGGSGDDTLDGEDGNDTLIGGIGNDTLNGDDGNDTAQGGTGNDIVRGGTGNDTLAGGLGRDILTGGANRDFFDFNSIKEAGKGAGRDIVLDFNRVVDDRIDLSTIDAKAGVAGNNAFKFIGTKAFHDVKGELRCKSGIIQGDVNGDGKADFEIKVNLATMVAGDFFL